jgi:hypothetical protein
LAQEVAEAPELVAALEVDQEVVDSKTIITYTL